jgi:predicted ABC-type ATPase
MPHENPVVIMIAGPNGEGKTTAAGKLFHELLRDIEFVNADVIAQGLSTVPESVAWQAGRIMLDRLHELANRRASMAFETTGASRSYASWLAGLKRAGYVVIVYYFWLPNADLAVARVAERVRRGGHFVPDETVRRRYENGLKNFFTFYLDLADRWEFLNNQTPATRSIAKGDRFSRPIVEDAILWKALSERYSKKGTP